MSMTKKDYEQLANILNYHNKGLSQATIEPLIQSLCGVYELENNKFDRKKFLTACGLEQDK